MRTIKFRGIDVRTNRWVYGSYYRFKVKNGELQHAILEPRITDFNGWSLKDTFLAYEIKPETLGQFTGLNDMHGKEIYEGDILQGLEGEQQQEKPNTIHSEVIYDVCGFTVFGQYMQDGYTTDVNILTKFKWELTEDLYSSTFFEIKDIEVVGNRYETDESF